MRVVEQHVRLLGTPVFVRDIGEGPPVVLINGIGAHTEMWRPLERALDGRRVVSFDAPGTGRSQTRPVPLTICGLARLVGQLFDRLGLDHADVVGYSFGSMVAQQFAISATDRVRRLVLAAALPGWGGVPGRLTGMLSLATPLRYYSRKYYEHTAGATGGGRARRDRGHVRRMWRDRSGHPPTFTGYAHQLWAVTMWSGLPQLARIRMPTLIVAGDDDPIVPMSNALMMASRMPAGRVLVGRGEGHFLLLDEHSAVLAPIRQFLAADDLGGSPVWRAAIRPEPAQVAAQLRRDGLGALPWGAISAVFRGTVG